MAGVVAAPVGALEKGVADVTSLQEVGHLRSTTCEEKTRGYGTFSGKVGLKIA